jgi:hypothetical protein
MHRLSILLVRRLRKKLQVIEETKRDEGETAGKEELERREDNKKGIELN